VVEQDRVPAALGQQGIRYGGIGNHAGLSAPLLQPPRDQRGFDALRRDQHHRAAGEIGNGERSRRVIACRQGNADLEGRAFAWRALKCDATAHALDDALGNAEAKAGAAIAARNAVVGLFEFAEDARLRLRRNADAGVAYHE